MTFSSETTALIIVDMQKGMANAGPRNNPETESHIEQLQVGACHANPAGVGFR